MNENEEKLRVIAEDCKAVIEEAKSMGCNKVRALYNIPLENMELIVQALEYCANCEQKLNLGRNEE